MSDFDLDAWIDDAKLPERSETVYGRADLYAEIRALEADLQAAKAREGDDRLGDPNSPVAIARRIQDTREQMAASALTFRFRALDRDTVRRIHADAPKVDGEPDADHIAREWVAAASVEPKLTAGQAQKLRDHIGEGQFALLWDAAFAATNDKRVSVPFSLSASAVLSRQDSSES